MSGRIGLVFAGLGLLAVGCKPAADDVTSSTPAGGLDLLGNGAGDVSDRLAEVGGRSDGLDQPQDLAFNPEVADELWVVNKADDSTSIFDAAGTPGQASTHIVDPYALHFMDRVSSIAFGAPGTFATCQDSRNTYNGQTEGNNFMGPTLWSSDREIFGFSNPEAVEYLTELFGFYADLGSHLDMLHESPNCVGITWDHDNVYWVFDGFHGSINRYDFQVDHGVGYDDHSDGIIARWVEGEVERVNGVVSHLELDHESGLLYIADTGNNRIAVLDTNSGERGRTLPAMEPGTDHHAWDGGELTTLVDGAALGMEQPAGLELIDGVLLVTDAGTGFVHAFDLEGNELDRADTGRGSGALAGLSARSLDDLWLVDAAANKVLRLQSGAPVAR